VTGLAEARDLASVVEFDPYIPLKFRAGPQLLPTARRIIVSNTPTDLLDLKVSDDPMVLHGFTVTLVRALHSERLAGEARPEPGLPVLALPEGMSFGDKHHVHIRVGSSVCLEPSAVEVRIGAAERFNRVMRHGRADFLVHDGLLVGMRVEGLDSSEVDSVRGCFHEGASLTPRPCTP
jgi:hypothetical protein